MTIAQGPWFINDLLTFTVTTHRFDTGAASDADGVPTYRIYEDETGTPVLTGSMAKLDDAGTAGFYSEQITLSAANGFEVGKSYNIYIAATVNTVAAVQSHGFKIVGNLPAAVNSIAADALNAAAVAADAVTKIQNGLATATALGVVNGNVNDIETLLAQTDADVTAIRAITDLLTAAQAEFTALPASNATPLAKLAYIFQAIYHMKIMNSATGKLTYHNGSNAAVFEQDVSSDATTTTTSKVNAL